MCIGGTWSEKEEAAWWRPRSVWYANMKNAGLVPLDDTEPFEWSSALSIRDADPTWRTAGLALKWYCEAKAAGDPRVQPDALLMLVAHSHGGQVAAHALAEGLIVTRLVTVGTPVRSDMSGVWALAEPHITDDWTHVYTDEVVRPGDPSAQPYQWLGSVPIQWLGSVPMMSGFTREFPQATRNVMIEPPETHHGLMTGKVWNDHALWSWLS